MPPQLTSSSRGRAPRGRIFSVLAISLALALFAAGCASPAQPGAQQFATAVTAARANVTTTFTSLSEHTRALAIDSVVAEGTLDEEALAGVPNAAVLAAWESVFDSVEGYATQLTKLSGSNVGTETAQSLRTAGEKLNQTSARVANGPLMSARLTDGLAKLAEIVLRARSRAKAQAIAREADPHVRKIFEGLAELVGDTNRAGLRGTAREHWQQDLAAVPNKFRRETKPEARRALVTDYLAIVAQRDRQDEALRGVRRSLLAVADAHTAFAQGRSDAAASAVDFILAELAHAREVASASRSKL